MWRLFLSNSAVNRNYIAQRLIFFAMIAAVIWGTISCEGPVSVPSASPTPCGCSPPELVTITPCPEVRWPSPPETSSRRLFYVLIDISDSYEERDNAITTLQEAIKSKLKPGDKVYVAVIGTDSMDADVAKFSGDVPIVPIPPTPTPIVLEGGSGFSEICPPTLTPLSTLETGGIGNGIQAYTSTKIAACNTSIVLTATAIAEEIRRNNEIRRQCSLYRQAEEYKREIQGWKEKQQNERDIFVSKLNEVLDELKQIDQSPETKYTDIFGALLASSKVLKAEISSGEFARVVLIILSDGKDTRDKNINELDFSGVEVFWVMQPFDESGELEGERWCKSISNASLCEVYPVHVTDWPRFVFQQPLKSNRRGNHGDTTKDN